MSLNLKASEPACYRFLSIFQKMLLGDMKFNTWYDVYRNQGSGGEVLPDWFYRNVNERPVGTIKAMVKAKALELRRDEDGLPQVRRLE